MPVPERSLSRLQRWMQAVITSPDGISAGVKSETAQSEIPLDLANLERVVARSRALGSIDRLAVYGNAYFARLIECLSEEFSALSHAVGPETFDSFALSYLCDCPSESYTLASLGARFPGFLRASRPADVPEPGWPDFLIDLATYERACAEIFDGPGPEGHDLLKPETVREIQPEKAGQVRLIPVPSLRVYTFRFPVHEYVTAVRRGENPDSPQAEITRLVMTRREFIVRRGTVSEPEYLLLKSIIAGCTLGRAIEQAVASSESDIESFAQNLQSWFRNWASAGWFESVEVGENRN